MFDYMVRFSGTSVEERVQLYCRDAPAPALEVPVSSRSRAGGCKDEEGVEENDCAAISCLP